METKTISVSGGEQIIVYKGMESKTTYASNEPELKEDNATEVDCEISYWLERGTKIKEVDSKILREGNKTFFKNLEGKPEQESPK